MKRIFALLLALSLALSLAACGEQSGTPDAPLPPPGSAENDPAVPPSDAPETDALKLDGLNIEFVIGERDAAELMALRTELPSLLIAALADQNCAVEKIGVTFGASAEATMQALNSGSIDVAFLPSEACILSDFRTRLIAVENAPVSASEYFPDVDFSDVSSLDADDLIYADAVAAAGDAPDALCDAFAAALVMLCADADGGAVMRHYGSASYLISGDFAALHAPLIDALALASHE